MYSYLQLLSLIPALEKNHAKEIVILLTQYHCLLSPRQVAQLKWSRCINTRGLPGCNVPCDLHLEHLNRCLKDMIRGLHSNVTPKALVCASQSVGIVHQVCDKLNYQQKLVYIWNQDVTLGHPSLRSARKW